MSINMATFSGTEPVTIDRPPLFSPVLPSLCFSDHDSFSFNIPTFNEIEPVIIDSPFLFSPVLPSLCFSDHDSFSLVLLDFLEASDTGIRNENSENPKSISESPIFDRRFRDIVEKVESLPLSKTIRREAITTIWHLIRDIDNNNLLWHKPVIEYERSEYMSIEWNKGSKRLYLNIDNDEQWWSTAWEKDGKTKVDFADLDYNNLSIHWEWLFNDQK